ncbi:hypothetical protein [Tardiphaga sp. 285_C5_N1_2]|uniref:hypothetical protein n=1 Tax=Tardiphaga sp. 285_C5_N1_2 TaxID=3240775 RepID=UPI003F8C916A
MNWTHAIVALLMMIGMTFPARSDENNSVLRLQCTWSRSLDTKTMKMSGTSGSTMVTVKVETNNVGRLRKEGLGAEFTAVITDEKINGKTEYDIGGMHYRERIKINRFTGAIESWFLIGKEGLVHYGTCAQLSNRLF